MDPRPAVLGRRLRDVRRILAVTGGKGGIGKSSVAVGLALAFAETGSRVGLLDLDLWGPSDHVILGVPRPGLHEDGGLVPDRIGGVALMSIASIVGDDPALLRGDEVSDAILELLAVTLWGGLDVLLVDMPPGFGDTFLDAARFLPGAEHLVVTTPSELTQVTTRKTLQLLARLHLHVLGVVENLRPDDGASDDGAGPGASSAGRPASATVPILGSIRRDDGYEASLGDLDRLRATAFYRDVRLIAARLSIAAAPS